jgi:hypothetical protein
MLGGEGLDARLAPTRVGAMIAWSASFAFGCRRVGSLSSTFAHRCTQQRCSGVRGHSATTGPEAERAVPTATTGARRWFRHAG